MERIGLNKIYLKDALEGLRQLPNNFADIIIADPPYNLGKDFGTFKVYSYKDFKRKG